jgi:hypothetical protein
LHLGSRRGRSLAGSMAAAAASEDGGKPGSQGFICKTKGPIANIRIATINRDPNKEVICKLTGPMSKYSDRDY